MTATLVGADLDLAANVGCDGAPQVAFDFVIGVNVITQRDELLVGQVFDADVPTDSSGCQGFGGSGATDAEDVGEGDFQTLLARKVNTLEACHVAVPFVVSHVRAFQASACEGFPREAFPNRQPRPSPATGPPGLISDVLVTSGKFAAANPDAVRRAVAAWNEAADWYKANPEQGRAIISKAVGENPDALSSAFDGVQYYGSAENAAEFAGSYTTTTLPLVMRAAKEAGLLAADVDLSKATDPQYLG